MVQNLDQIRTIPPFSERLAQYSSSYSCWIQLARYPLGSHYGKLKMSDSKSTKEVDKGDRVAPGQLHDNQQPPNRSRFNSLRMETEYSCLHSSEGQPQPQMDSIPWEPHPRVPVTAGMLCGYSYMRGRTNQDNDPLNNSLYPAPARHFSQHNIVLPPVTNRKSMEELPRSALFFWDPVMAPSSPSPPQSVPAPTAEFIQARSPNERGSTRNAQRHKLSLSGFNHYKGDMVYANFGYFLVDGQWVDPESEGELYEAYMKVSDDSSQDLDVPELHRSRDFGPHIMTQDEQNEFYRAYVEDVTDEHDDEGDPRDFYITPATFARWAEGAVKVDGYVETVIEPSANIPSPKCENDENKVEAPKCRVKTQIDVETGSVLSGVYDPESNPSVLDSPRGVNLGSRPRNFSYSYPQTAIDQNREAFGDACRRTADWIDLSVASTPDVFTSEAGCNALADSDEPLSGKRNYNIMGNRILHLEDRRNQGNLKIKEKRSKVNDMGRERLNLEKEIIFMGERLANAHLSPSRSPSPPPVRPQSPSAPPQRRNRQYQRYFAERTEQEEIAIARNQMVEEQLDNDYQMAMDEIGKLRRLKDELIEKMRNEIGLTEIPDDLIPERVSE